METLNTTAPSIASAAMLVELNISSWTGRKLDKRASSEVTSSNNAARGVANVSKKLLGDCDELTAITKFVGVSRNMHYAMTMPWSNSGLRLLPTAQFFKYQEAMTDVQQEFNRLVDNFLRVYDWEITEAQAKLGALFNPNDYPSTERLRSRFGFWLNYTNVPESGDFRVDLPQEAVAQIKSDYDDFYGKQLTSAMNDVWKRTYTALSKMSERLDYADHEKKKIFRDSLIDNVMEMVEMLRVCNITHDTQMTAMADSLTDALQGITPEALREDAYLRTETKRAVDQAIKALPSLDL
jgi:hypothetical protein